MSQERKLEKAERHIARLEADLHDARAAYEGLKAQLVALDEAMGKAPDAVEWRRPCVPDAMTRLVLKDIIKREPNPPSEPFVRLFEREAATAKRQVELQARIEKGRLVAAATLAKHLIDRKIMAETPIRTPGTDDWTFTWEIWVSPAPGRNLEPRPAQYVAESIQHAAPVIPSKTSDARAPRLDSLVPGTITYVPAQTTAAARCGAAAPRSTAVCRRQPGHIGGHHADPNIRWPRAAECDHRYIAHHSPTTPGTTPGWRCEACGTGITPATFANNWTPGITWTEGTPTSRYERTAGRWDYREVVEPRPRRDRPFTQLERAEVLAPVAALFEAELRRNVRLGYDPATPGGDRGAIVRIESQSPTGARVFDGEGRELDPTRVAVLMSIPSTPEEMRAQGLTYSSGQPPSAMREVLMRQAEGDLAVINRAVETATFGRREYLGEFPDRVKSDPPPCEVGKPCDKCFAVECAGGCGKCDHDPLNAGGFKSTTTVEEID